MHYTNNVKVLDAIREMRGEASRKEIAARTGLAWGTMYKTVENLLARGLVFARQSKSVAPGRPTVPLCINADSIVYGGIDVGSETTRILFCDLNFREIHREKCPTERFRDPARFVEWLDGVCRRSLEEFRPVAVGLSVSGVIDSERGIIVSGGNFGMKRGTDLPVAEIAARFGVPVFAVTTQVGVAAAEYHFGRNRGCGHLVTVGLGVGIGSGAVVNHHLLISHPQRPVGYIGHILIPGNNRLCSCGFRGCLEAFSGGHYLAAIAAERFPGRPELHDAAALDRFAAAGDADAAGMMIQAAQYNAAGIAAMIQLYSPEALIFTGGQSRPDGFLYNETLRQLQSLLPPERSNCSIGITSLGEFGSALGAARLAYEQFV